MAPSRQLEGKVCLITGGANGIGETTAKLFAERGAKVLIADIDEASGRTIEAGAEDGSITFRKVDLTRVDEILEFVNWASSNFGTLDVLINNASRSSRFDVLDTSIEEWNRMLSLNLTAPFLLSKFAAQTMIRHGINGKIINISSILALSPMGASLVYSTTKGGLISMTRCLAIDLAKYRILATTVIVGGPINISKEEDSPELRRVNERAATLLGRVGKKEEVAKLLAFLASDDNTFMTGNEIIIDGGRIISRKADPVEVSDKDGSRLFARHH
jgi:NAD(P)-dependent dehydrogenase (short-subunit alcohol dehydrogenase family)